MDVRESKIVEAIELMTNEELLGLLSAAVKTPLIQDCPRPRGYLSRELSERILRIESCRAAEARPPELGDADLLSLAEWVLASFKLTAVCCSGGQARLANAIAGATAATVSTTLIALHSLGVRA